MRWPRREDEYYYYYDPTRLIPVRGKYFEYFEYFKVVVEVTRCEK